MSTSPTGSRSRKRDPAIIQQGPIVPDPANVQENQDRNYIQIMGKLSAELEETRAENAKLKNDKAFDLAVAGLITPFSNKIYYFVVGYCVFVAVIIVLSGFPVNFKLPDSVLATLVGSTAVAVLALIGSVVTGLFKRHSRS